MTFGRVGRAAAMVVCILAWGGCGDVFRPVAIPITPTQPNPSSLHYMLTLSSNGAHNAGASTRIDVSGDSSVGTAPMGLDPVHAAILPSGTTVYVANQMEDTVSFYSPSSISPVSTISLPPGAAPAFVAATQNDTVYVADSGTNTVAAIPTASNVVTNFIPVGVNPVAMAETPDGRKLYVANQGSGTVSSINTLDKTVSQTITTGASPSWAVARADGGRVYVLNSGSGTISVIDPASDSVVGSAAVTAGANYMIYDKSHNRLYAINPNSTVIQSFDASADPPAPLPSVDLAAGANAPCAGGCSPAGIAALPDGSRIYVTSFRTSANCTEAADNNALGCISAQVTVINAASLTVAKTIAITLADTAISPPGTKPDTPLLAACNSARFRLFTAASADSTRVYISYCDAGTTAVVRTVPNTSPGTESAGDYLVNELQAPQSALPPAAAGGQPPPQNPVFVVTGP